MSEIHADGGPLPHVPDDWTIEQFILDGQHPVKPQWYDLRPVLIDEITGREMGSDEVSTRLCAGMYTDCQGCTLPAQGADTRTGQRAEDTLEFRSAAHRVILRPITNAL